MINPKQQSHIGKVLAPTVRTRQLPNATLRKTYERLFTGGQRLGRFRRFRQLYSYWRRRSQPTAAEPLAYTQPTTLQTIATADMLAATQQEGVAFGLQIPLDVVDTIYAYACQQECFEPNYEPMFKVSSLDRAGYLLDGHQPVRALVAEPTKCPEIDQLSQDPILLGLARGYLGYVPDRISCHLTWSLQTRQPLTAIQKQYPPTNYHYDIAGYNFVTAYFYMTPVLSLEAGPHIMLRRSHNSKPWWMLLRSCRQDAAVLYQHYGQDSELTILGQAGFGFFQDPSCFHRVYPPSQNHRLLLQFRYA
ncbi:MAG: hypothetical protein F6K00_12100 [Leptolyngbya sp. SIOISBB]|nr:hypothetical protein [Leptolyngbya sp. SIOISBB]